MEKRDGESPHIASYMKHPIFQRNSTNSSNACQRHVLDLKTVDGKFVAIKSNADSMNKKTNLLCIEHTE